jgi:hypothetical protein
MGYAAGQGCTGASSFNVAIGDETMLTSGEKSYNTAVGSDAMRAITTGSANVGVGYNSLTALTTGTNNVAMGSGSLDANTTGGSNTAIGENALTTNTTASNNTAVGKSALQDNTTGTQNTAVGANALDAATTAANNTAVGYASLTTATTGHSNASHGSFSLANSTTGSENSAIGHNSGADITTGNSNTCIGYRTGEYGTLLQTGNGNVLLGAYTRTSATNSSYANGIGYDINATAGYTTIGSSGSDIRAQNGVATWSTVSDERVKKDITDAEAGLSFINDLRPRTFKYKAKGDLPKEFHSYEEGSTETYKNEFTNHGFIAQEVKEAVDNHPELKDGFKMWDVREDSGQQEVGEAAVIPVLVKAVQELSTMVDDLKQELKTLKGE